MFKRLIEIRNNIFLGNRLKLFVIAISILIFGLGFVSVRSITKINNRITQTNEIHIKSLIKLSVLIENIYGIILESHIVDEKSLNENAIENSVNLDLISTYLSEYEQSITNQVQRSSYDGFLLEFQNYLNILREVNSLTAKGDYRLAAELKNEREYKSYKKLQSIIKTMMDYNVNGLEDGNKIIEQLKRKSFFWVYFISLFALVIIILIAIYIFKDIDRSLKLLLNNLTVLNQGQIPENMLSVYKNEIGTMANLTNGLTRNMSELNNFANDISKGIYSSDYKLVGEDDLLGKALVNLRNSLIITKEEDEKRKIDEERRNWTNRGHAIFGEILRQRSRELNQLTDDIIKNLVYYLKANQGGLFIINDTTDIPKIELLSAFAYDRKKFLERTINIGDGLIGTVALERNTVYLKEIPEDYIEIESGLGEASPNFLLIVPLKFEEEILGIVELASFKEFLDYEIKFTEEVAQSIASTLLTAKINTRTEQLLNESRKQSENLALQEVEARQNIEEMRAAQELAQRREADLSGILSAVDNTLMKGEYELDGTLISVNNRHLQTMGYQLKEIKGKNIEMFVPKDELVHFRKVWANVVAGNPRQLEVRRRTKSGEILWLINQYTPVTDITGKISKILYLAHDITQYKKSEEEIASSRVALDHKEKELQGNLQNLENIKQNLESMESELQSIYKAVDLGQLTMELDTNSNILKANNLLLKLFNLYESDIYGKKFTDIFISDKTNEQLESIFENNIKGIAITIESKYNRKNNSSIWLNEIYAPILDANNKIIKILVIANNITQLKDLENIKPGLSEKSVDEAFDLSLYEKEIEERIRKSIIESGELDEKSIDNLKTIEAINQSLPKIVTDLELNIISTNKKFSELFKYPERELINKHLSRVVTSKDKDVLSIPKNELIEGVPLEIQLNLQAKDKQIIPVIFNLIPLNLDKKGSEKIIIYISAIDYIQTSNTDMHDIGEEIQARKKELKEITERIGMLKKEKESQISQINIDSDSDKLYQNWLASIKSELDKK
jgi:PAS domain S-box-containing protein